jgi:hypothetical protein
MANGAPVLSVASCYRSGCRGSFVALMVATRGSMIPYSAFKLVAEVVSWLSPVPMA